MSEVLLPHEQRVVDEQKELEIKLTALTDFLSKGRPKFIDAENWHLLDLQQDHMTKYNAVLLTRIELFGAEK